LVERITQLGWSIPDAPKIAVSSGNAHLNQLAPGLPPRSIGARFGRILPKLFDRVAWRGSRRHARRQSTEASAAEEETMNSVTRRSILAAAPATLAVAIRRFDGHLWQLFGRLISGQTPA
jgi:hypothetical protein